ncbi:MAG: hypothetical protein ACK55Z_28085, partial [bacterium]
MMTWCFPLTPSIRRAFCRTSREPSPQTLARSISKMIVRAASPPSASAMGTLQLGENHCSTRA